MIEWKFTGALAPWKDGIYERLIGITKNSLRCAIGRRKVSDSELRTLLSEVEGTINERLWLIDSMDILRPIDFLLPRAFLILDVPSEGGIAKADPLGLSNREKLLLQWNRTQQCLAVFWKFWQRDYLNVLCERTQRFRKGPHSQTLRPPRIGEKKKCLAGLVKITQLNQGLDNQISKVELQTQAGQKICRPISLLYPLGITETVEEDPKALISQVDPNLDVSDSDTDEVSPHFTKTVVQKVHSAHFGKKSNRPRGQYPFFLS
uniref:DUF5641 domain-containing protein n=1 Tax=Gongylonema pulchrum TaxID=637853 RepID=A0A183DHU8_9BILA